MMLQDLESGRQELLGPGNLPFYSPSGHLVYHFNQALWALPFSLSSLKPAGEAFPIAQNGRNPSVAADGTLVYFDGSGLRRQQLVWLDRDGNKTGEIGPVTPGLRDLELSPDGRLVGASLSGGSGGSQDVWVYDTARGLGTLVSASSQNDFSLLWSPTGEDVAFTSNRQGNADIFLRRSDGAGNEQALLATPRIELATDWSRDGKYLVFSRRDPEHGYDIWYLERHEDGSGWEEKLFLQTPAMEGYAKLSSDGRYLAYVSDGSGQNEVYVLPFPDGEGGRRVTVSNNGGGQPALERGRQRAVLCRGRHVAGGLGHDGLKFLAGSGQPRVQASDLETSPQSVSAIRRLGRWTAVHPSRASRRAPEDNDPCRPKLARRVPRPRAGLACISHHLMTEARNKPAITSLRLLAVLNVLSEYASLIKWGSSSGARLVLTRLSRTSSRHVVRRAG